MAMKLD